MSDTYVIVPNWNGKKLLGKCIDSLLDQSRKTKIIVVENGSTDGSLDFIYKNYPEVELVINKKNLGFAGGVNSGIKRALENKAKYVALFNNDAVADRFWLENLVTALDSNQWTGIATCSFISSKDNYIDSTGDQYSVWGLPYPRGRGESDLTKYRNLIEVFAASGGASLYRAEMLKEIGLFDEDFFAYYEDVDLSFRAQLANWKIEYVPKAIAYHSIGATSSKIKGFTTYQSAKNLPWLLYKNVPARLLPTVIPRFTIAYMGFYARALTRGQFWPVTKGAIVSTLLMPKKLVQRYNIQKNRKVSTDYISSIMTHDLPPDADALLKLRTSYRRIMGKS